MPVLSTGSWLSPATKPEWCDFAAAGRFAVPLEGGRFERHHHDADEVWFISEGKGKILVDGMERYVRPNDIVLTRAGESHDFLEVYEPVRGFFLVSGHPKGGRPGHLYEDEAAARGHDVPAAPAPADFPA